MTPTIEPAVEFSPAGATRPEHEAAAGAQQSPPPARTGFARGDLRPKSILPGRILIALTFHPKLRVKKGLPVDLRREGEVVIAIAEDLGEFGYGPTTAEALQDLIQTVQELFFHLNDPRIELSSDLQDIRLRLNEHIELR